MSASGTKTKVGLFMVVGIILFILLVLSFSKGLSFFKSTYTLRLVTSNVGGIRAQAAVLMSGVLVGNVTAIDLNPDGKSVVIFVQIYHRYKIYEDAIFTIDSMGLLGDQYVGVRPQQNVGKLLQDGQQVACQEPFNVQELAKASVGFIHRLDQTAERLDVAVKRLNDLVLNENSLTNFSIIVTNFRQVSEKSLETVDALNRVLGANAPSVETAVTNVVAFSEQLRKISNDLDDMVNTNKTDVQQLVHNFREASSAIEDLTRDAQAGKGLVGALLKDNALKNELSSFVTNANHTAENLNIFSSNLNNRGIWAMFKHPKNQPLATTNDVRERDLASPKARR